VFFIQNCFLEQRHVASNLSYPIPKEQMVDGKVTGGSLAVTNSSQILPVVQAWIDHFDTHGAHVLASLDWHSGDHCSFCRNGTKSTNPTGFLPFGAVCGPYGETQHVANNKTCDESNRCTDFTSQYSWEHNGYMQWPDHCVRGTFSARMDASLHYPASALVVKKGYVAANDSYSAFGGSLSIEAYPFDTSDNDPAALSQQPSLTDVVVRNQIRRLWVMGLATDYCVENSVLDSLGANAATGRPKPPTLAYTIMVTAGMRGVSPATTAAALETAKASGAILVSSPAVEVAYKEFISSIPPARGAAQAAGLVAPRTPIS